MIKNTILITLLTFFLAACGGSSGGVSVSDEDHETSQVDDQETPPADDQESPPTNDEENPPTDDQEDASLTISGNPSVSVKEESLYTFNPVVSSTDSVTLSITNKPSWLSFDALTGALEGTPNDADVGVHNGITITADNGSSQKSIGPFSIVVEGINDAPTIQAQTFNAQTFDSSVSLAMSVADVDHDLGDLAYTITDQPQFGTVAVEDANTATLSYSPTSLDALQGDSFTLHVNDGELVSDEVTITIGFVDTSAPQITITPSDGALNVYTDSIIKIDSDDPIDASTVSYNGSNGACTGSIQISQDNFANCLSIDSVSLSDFNRSAQVQLSADLSESATYKVKVDVGLKNVFDIALNQSITSSFETINGLIITEVSECYYSNTYCWFELYNPTSSNIDLSDYSFKSVYVDGSFFQYDGAVEFALPSQTINPGQYVVIRSDNTGGSFTSNNRIVYVHQSGNYPLWRDAGFIDLIKNGDTQDFVTFGSSYTPTTAGAWSGSYAPALRAEADKYGTSIGRDGSNTDTDSESDWNSYSFATLGGVNDVECTTDADNDGIPDCSEQPGSTYAGLPLYEWGARTGQKDIFIELDYMDATNGGAQVIDEAIVPRKEALQKVVDVFSEQGIAMHIDVGDLYDNAAGTDPADFDLGGGQEVPFVDAMKFDTSPSVYDYKLQYFDYARFQVFHYLLFVNTQDGTAGSSGLAEINGNDLIVSLGEWGLNSNSTANTNRLINYQASTLMHELGHNLGLLHGGNEGENHKPNYFSIMNYLYQLNGLSEIGNNEGDRYYDHYFDGNANCDGGLTNSPLTDTFIMDFSHGVSADIDKQAANESLGLGQLNTSGVDFNCDGTVTDDPDARVDTDQGIGAWSDYDDWGNINLDFRNYFSGNLHGISLIAKDETMELMPDKIGDDRAPVAKEYSPSPEFFEKLKEQMSQ
ncbi:lamin tail domain-containing protein [Bermanella sp. R86510]|uniref:lamin tail domain-containing protein n=1 Tax=unclassified Bermanella TaxID=2627862 RepID=UPI0037C916E6